jgi:hypothetical protein
MAPAFQRKITLMDLSPFSRKYIWWWPRNQAVTDPHRVVVQVMNIGTLEDVEKLRQGLGDTEFRKALQEARPGELSDRSWHFWHLVLGVSEIGEVPPLPVRKFG